MVTEKDPRTLSKDEIEVLLGPEHSPDGSDKIRVLIVEDELTTQMLYDKGLFNEVFDKKMVASGKEALLVYAEWHPDIIVLDIFLREMTGYQVLKEIRTTFEDKKTTIVMATSLSGSEDVQSCLKQGIEGYIIKPFLPREIAAKILGYYAKREPERARNADAVCREIVKQSRIRWLLAQDLPKGKENKNTSHTGDAASETGTGDQKKAGEAPAEK